MTYYLLKSWHNILMFVACFKITSETSPAYLIVAILIFSIHASEFVNYKELNPVEKNVFFTHLSLSVFNVILGIIMQYLNK